MDASLQAQCRRMMNVSNAPAGSAAVLRQQGSGGFAVNAAGLLLRKAGVLQMFTTLACRLVSAGALQPLSPYASLTILAMKRPLQPQRIGSKRTVPGR